MTNLLSLFVCLAMLFSGGYAGQEPGTPSSMVATISDVIVSINGTDYALNPSIAIGVSTNGSDSALFDVSMPMGEDVLFPIQAKLDPSGATVMLGDSSTAHNFSAEYLTEMMDLDEIPAELTEMNDKYVGMISALSTLDQDQVNEAINTKFAELVGDVETEAATFDIDGQELEGEHGTFTLDNEQVGEFIDFVYDQIPGFSDLYLGYMNMVLSMSGMDVQFQSFSDMMAQMGMECTFDFDLTGNETSGILESVIHMSIDESEMALFDESEDATDDVVTLEPTVISIEIPVTTIVHDENNYVSYIYFTEENISGIEMDEDASLECSMSASTAGDDTSFSLTVSADDGYDPIDMDVTINTSTPEDDSANTILLFSVSSEYTNVDFCVNSLSMDDGSSISRVDALLTEYDYDDNEESIGVSFTVTAKDTEIEDRIAAASETEVYNTDEDIENASTLMMSVMGLATDVEKLQNDESITALIDGFNSLFGTSVDYIDTDYPVEDSDDPSELPYAIPEFTWLPEGYELTETDVSASIGSVYLYFDSQDTEEYHSTLYVSLYDASNETSSVSYVDGVAITSPVISIEREDDCVYAYATMNGIEFDLSYYDTDLSDEDIIAFFDGIVFK